MSARDGDRARVRVATRLEDGTLLDDSELRFEIGMGEVIEGIDRGVIGMRAGEKRTLHLPPELAYGSRGAPPRVPPETPLVVELELIAIER